MNEYSEYAIGRYKQVQAFKRSCQSPAEYASVIEPPARSCVSMRGVGACIVVAVLLVAAFV